MVTSGFFNSVNGDRKYSAEQMSAIFNGIINDGVFVNVGTAFAITADVGNKVLVGVGRAWIDSTWIYNDTPLEVELEDSDILTDRIDAVVLESDHSAPVRIGSIKVVKGVAQTNPVRPTMEHSFYVNQYPIAYILRPKNSTAITQANITYMVGTSELPFVTGILETLDIDALVAQWGAEWREWFDAIKAATSGDIVEYQQEWDEWFQNAKDQLSGDVAGNLLLQIDDVKGEVSDLQDDILTRYGVRTSGSLFYNDVFQGNIDELIPTPDTYGLISKTVNEFCGTYLCHEITTGGTLPDKFIDKTTPPAGNYFLLTSDPITNGYVQFAYPYIYTRTNDGDPRFAVRCYIDGNWTSWQYMGESGDGKFLPLTGGTITGSIIADKWAAFTTKNPNSNYRVWMSAESDHALLRIQPDGGDVTDVMYYRGDHIRSNVDLYMMNNKDIYMTGGNKYFSMKGSATENGIVFYDENRNHVATIGSTIKFNRNTIFSGIGGITHDDNYNRLTIFDPANTANYWQHQIGKMGINNGFDQYLLREVYNNTGKTAYYINNSSFSGATLFSFHMEFYGSIGATAFEKDSSRLIKENIESLSEEDANKILDLRPVTFDFIESYGGAKGRIGLIAEEVVEVFPSVVTIPEEIDVENGKVPSIEYSELIAPLIKLTQMQQERIDEQDRKIEDLESRLAQVESLLNKL